MADLPLLKPELYNEPPGTDAVLLRGGRCVCGYGFFPYQDYGCEQCGSRAVEPWEVPAEGALVSSARVHVHKGEGRRAPFWVASIRLSAGPVVRTLLDYPVDREPLTPGCAVTGVLVTVADPEGEPTRDLRFRPLGG